MTTRHLYLASCVLAIFFLFMTRGKKKVGE